MNVNRYIMGRFQVQGRRAEKAKEILRKKDKSKTKSKK